MQTNGLTVFLCGVTLVRQPVILRIFLSELVHIIVAIGLGEDTRCRNREVLAITLDDAGVG